VLRPWLLVVVIQRHGAEFKIGSTGKVKQNGASICGLCSQAAPAMSNQQKINGLLAKVSVACWCTLFLETQLPVFSLAL